jgi:putative nucleotidyltransferase with HDIG domain
MTINDGRSTSPDPHADSDSAPEYLHKNLAPSAEDGRSHNPWHPGTHFRRALSKVNRELWLVLSMLGLAFALNYLVTGHRILLGFYTFPTLFAAYFYGRKHATLTAVASVFLVWLLAEINPGVLSNPGATGLASHRWHDIAAWGGVLVITAYAMGSLHEHHKARIQELINTYRGLLVILRHFISKDKYTENHSYRVSVYAAKIATYMGLADDRIEDVRAASLIHDIGKLKTSRDLLHKAARLAGEEFEEVRRHVDRGASMLEPVGGPLHRIIPIILAHHDKFDGTGYHEAGGADIPLEARIIAVADWYDSLTSDRPYRRAMSPFDAKEAIFRESGTEFDPEVVDAFIQAFRENEMEIPEVLV